MHQSDSFSMHTFKNVRLIVLFRVSLLCYGYFGADLEEVGTRGEIRDGIRHDEEHLYKISE